MTLFQLLFLSFRCLAGAGVGGFVLMIVTAALGGRGTSRFAWLLPLDFLATLAVFALTVVLFHRGAARLLPGSTALWLASALHAAVSIVLFVLLAFGTLVILNR